MTPTEQDNELRDKVATIVEYWDFSPLQDEDTRIERLKNEILQLITADRKRVALDARLDELIWSTGVTYKYDKDRQIVQDRIAELKAQQEDK